MELVTPAMPPRPYLPAVGAFLRETLSLGARSIRPALPALVFLCCYRFGMGLYFEVASGRTTPFGEPDERAQIIHLMMSLCAYLPLLVLIYLPFLPLQDAIRRQERLGFLDSVRRVLERFPALAGSGIVQSLVIGIPSAIVLLVGAAFVAGAGAVSQQAAAVAVLLLLVPVGIWIALASAYFTFAPPAIILDDSGPIDGTRDSVSLVWRNFWGLMGRFLVWSILATLAYVVANFPSTMLEVGAKVAGTDPIPVKIARVLWTSIVTAVLLPFWVSAVLALYRGLVPGAAAAGGGAATPAPAVTPPSPEAPAPSIAPFAPTPPSPDAPNPEGNPQLFE